MAAPKNFQWISFFIRVLLLWEKVATAATDCNANRSCQFLDDLRNEDNLKNKYDLKNEDRFKIKDDVKNEDDLKN